MLHEQPSPNAEWKLIERRNAGPKGTRRFAGAHSKWVATKYLATSREPAVTPHRSPGEFDCRRPQNFVGQRAGYVRAGASLAFEIAFGEQLLVCAHHCVTGDSELLGQQTS